MRIKKVGLTGVKGVTAEVELSPLTLIAGEPWSGKTAVADAISVALTGYVPRLGKTPTATMDMASGRTMACHVTFDSGERRWWEGTRNGRSVTTSSGGDGGAIADFDPTGLDLNVWLGLRSAKDRASYVFERCGVTRDAIQKKRAEIEEMFAASVKDGGDEAKKAVMAIVSSFFRTKLPEIEVPEAIEWLVESFAKLSTDAKTAAERAKSTCAELTTTVSMMLPIEPSDDVTVLEGVLQRLRGEQLEVTILHERATSAASKLEKLKASIGAGSAPINARIKVCEERIRDVRERLRAAESSSPVDAVGLEDRIKAVKCELQAASEDMARVRQQITSLEVRPKRSAVLDRELAGSVARLKEEVQSRDECEGITLEQIQRKKGEAERDLIEERRTIANLEAKVASLLENPTANACCEACGQALPPEILVKANLARQVEAAGKKKDLEVATAIAQDLENRVAQLTTMEGKVKERDALKAKLVLAQAEEVSLKRAEADEASTLELIEEHRRNLASLSQKASMAEGLLAKLSAQSVKAESPVKNLRALRIELSDEEEELDSQRARLAQITSREQELEELRASIVGESITEIEERRKGICDSIDVYVKRLADVNALLREKSKQDAIREELARAEVMAQDCVRDHKAYCAVAKASVALRSEIIDKSVGAVVERANLLGAGIIKGRVGYENGSFHVERDGRAIEMSTWSGAELRIIYASIQMALTDGNAAKIVIIDEMGTMGTKIQTAVLERAKELIAQGTIDQFIGIMPSTKAAERLAESIDGVSVIDMDK